MMTPMARTSPVSLTLVKRCFLVPKVDNHRDRIDWGMTAPGLLAVTRYGRWARRLWYEELEESEGPEGSEEYDGDDGARHLVG